MSEENQYIYCCDCQSNFENIIMPCCPACGGKTWKSLSKQSWDRACTLLDHLKRIAETKYNQASEQEGDMLHVIAVALQDD